MASINTPPEPAWVEARDGKLRVYHVEAAAGSGVKGILMQLGVGSV